MYVSETWRTEKERCKNGEKSGEKKAPKAGVIILFTSHVGLLCRCLNAACALESSCKYMMLNYPGEACLTAHGESQ